MLEIIIIDYLREKLAVPVYMELPTNPPEDCIVVERTGSSTWNRLPTATLAIQSYGSSLYAAASLNEKLKRAMAHAAELTEISRAALNSDYNFTDMTLKRYRYQAVYDITYFEEET